jgi:hypothetical protein
MIAIAGTNLALRFFLELGALAALGTWGWKAGGAPLAVAAPLAAAVLWGLFASPNATIAAPDVVRVGVQVLVLGGAAVALAASRSGAAGGAFAAVVAANAALMAALDQ